MASATKRTSVLLGALALVFVIIIVILCIVPKAGSPGHETLTDSAKSGERTDVLTDTSTASTTTTTTTTTTPAPPPPPTTETTETATTPTTTPAPPPPPPAPTTTETATTTDTTPTSTPAPPPPPPAPTTAETATTTDTTPTSTPASPAPPAPTRTETATTTDTTPTRSPAPPTTTTNATDYIDYDSLSNDTTVHDSTDDTALFTTDDSTTVTTLPTTDDSTTVTTLPTTDDSTTVTTLPTTDDSTTVTTLSTTDDSTNDTSLFTTDDSTNDTSLFTTDDSTTVTTLPTTDDSTNDTTLSTTEQPTTIITPAATNTTTAATTLSAATTTSPEEVEKLCETPACKTLASNMLATMDHAGNVDRCEDFYQYACGGLMKNPFLHPRDPEVIARHLIKEELETTDPDEGSAVGKMRIFYDSCLGAVDQNATQGWQAAMQEVFGPSCFDWTSPSAMAPLNLTLVLAKLMQHDFTPFFDVDLDVDHNDNSEFSVTLSPALPGSPFSDDLASRACLEAYHRRLEDLEDGESVDINEEYSVNFTECVWRGEGLEARMERMEEAVRTFGLLDHLGDSATANGVLQATKSKTKRFLMDLLDVSPKVATVKQSLLKKDVMFKKIDELNNKVINWKALVSRLISVNDISLVRVSTYLWDELTDILSVLQRHNNDSSTALGSVLMMLWSERLYTDFVKPLGSGVGEPDYCLQASVTLMQDTASKLYMNTLSNEEVDARTIQIANITASIKRAGVRELQREARGKVEVQEKLEAMLGEGNVITTSVTDRDVEESAKQLNITRTDSFFDNCIRLLVNKRRLRYDMYKTFPGDVPWKFMRPYDAFGVHVYALNRIMVPFAAQDDSRTFDAIPAYLSYAGIGHMISHLAMHGYDTSGLYFQADGTKNLLDDQRHYTDLQRGLLEQYMANTSYVIAGSGGVKGTVKMGALALNELLADSGAARLAWEAYTMRNEPDVPMSTPSMATHVSQSSRRRRRRSPQDLSSRIRRLAPVLLPSIESEEEALPWVGLSPIQLYFLHWSQRYCSPSGGMDLLELMESEQPPARMRVNLVLQNEPLFNQAFNCTPKSVQTPFVLG